MRLKVHIQWGWCLVFAVAAYDLHCVDTADGGREQLGNSQGPVVSSAFVALLPITNLIMGKAALLVALLVLVGHQLLCCPVADEGSMGHLRQLFDKVDKDHDGQLHEPELRQFISRLALSFDNSKLDRAVEGAIGRLDSPDHGIGVSQAELEHHLRTMMQV
jgi:hypothetical protein